MTKLTTVGSFPSEENEPITYTIKTNAVFPPMNGGTTNYESLNNKPQINGVELVGNKTLEELGYVPYDDTTVKEDITNLENDKADKTEIPDVSEFITDTEVDNKLLTKQNTLTAGENITIKNDIISASGGTSGIVITYLGSGKEEQFLEEFNKYYEQRENIIIMYRRITFLYSGTSGSDVIYEGIKITSVSNQSFDYANYEMEITISNNIATKIRTNGSDVNTFGKFLTTNKTNSEYTPTGDYHPATKKYVDDAVANALGDVNTILATLTTPSEEVE